MNLKKIIVSFATAMLLVAGSYYFLDARVALFVKNVLMSNLSFFSSTVPDFLFPFVCVSTAIAWTAYFYLSHKGVYNLQARFFQLVAVTVPLAFVLKSVLKFAVGRIDTRFWLRFPRSKEFHWFHGGGNFAGFPSGHMAVFAAFFIAVAIFYPRYRYACFGFLSVLALALIVTNYHFLSDVIAGTYLGVFVTYSTYHGLAFLLRSKEENRDMPRAVAARSDDDGKQIEREVQ